MKKEKKLSILLFIPVVAIAITILFLFKTTNNVSNNKFFTVTIETDMAFNLDSVEKISDMATVMVKGEVIDTNTFTINNNDQPQVVTLVKVNVSHDYKGNIQDDQEVYFIQHGGVVKIKDLDIPFKNLEEEDILDSEKAANVILNGVEVSQIGDQVLFFAVEITDDFYNLNLNEGYYETVGDYQGRFDLEENTNNFVRKEPLETNISSKFISSDESKQPITIINNDVDLENASYFK